MSDDRSVARPLAWSIADQAVSSLSTLVLTALVARVSPPAAFGAFALVLGAYPVAITAMRALAAEPMAILHGRGDPAASARSVVSVAMCVGAISGVALLVGAGFTEGDLRSLLLVVGVASTGLVLQDGARAALLVLGRPRAAFANDALWLVVQVAATGLLLASDRATTVTVTMAWAASGFVLGLVGLAQLRTVPGVGRAVRWVRDQRRLWPSLLVEHAVTVGAWQVALIVLVALNDTAAAAGVRGAQTLFGPVAILHLAMTFTVVPLLGRRFREDRTGRSGVQLAAAVAVGLAGASIVATVVLLVVPDGIGEAVLGESWGDARGVVLPFGIYLAGTGVNIGALLGLRALAATRRSVSVRLVSGAALLIGTAIGGAVASTTGFIVALTTVTWASTALWWHSLRSVVRTREPGT